MWADSNDQTKTFRPPFVARVRPAAPAACAPPPALGDLLCHPLCNNEGAATPHEDDARGEGMIAREAQATTTTSHETARA